MTKDTLSRSAFVQVETATVFKGGKRRRFSKKAAYNDAARAKISARPNRQCPGHDRGDGEPFDGKCSGRCWYADRRETFYDEFVGRVARMLRQADERRT